MKRIDRANGDALLYDAKSNTFAVVTKAGAPRTMFKPRDGALLAAAGYARTGPQLEGVRRQRELIGRLEPLSPRGRDGDGGL